MLPDPSTLHILPDPSTVHILPDPSSSMLRAGTRLQNQVVEVQSRNKLLLMFGNIVQLFLLNEELQDNIY